MARKEKELVTLPELVELEGEWTKRALHLLEMGAALKAQIGEKSDERNGKEGYGLLGKLSEIEEELRLVQVEHDLQGLKHNKLQFTARIRDGRETFQKQIFMQELAEAGVELRIIKAAMAAATKKGESFWVREWKEAE